MIYEIRCHNDQHCSTVQNTLFANGYRWAIHGQVIREVESLSLFINNGTKAIRTSPISWLGFEKQAIPISLSELLQL